MSSGNLGTLERDVERARAKLADDLARLRSPQMRDGFRDDLVQEAMDVKDAAVEKVTQAAGDGIQRVVEDIKARAIANPAAAAAIAGGIAWRLVKRPPIASLMIGLGAWSLWRTQPASDYDVKKAGDAATAMLHRVGSWKEQTAETVSHLANEAGGIAEQVASSVKGAAEQMALSANGAVEKVKDTATRVADTAGSAASRVNEAITQLGASTGDAATEVRRLASDDKVRDGGLLVLAALAIAAAAGVSYQQRAE